MPHDHAHDHDHDHDHGPGHHHHPHAGTGHNRPGAEHLHSHMDPADEAADLQALTDEFIAGFVAAKDKTSFLRIAGVPFEKGGLKLVDVRLTTGWQVGTASPGFGTRELSYLPFPGAMVSERTDMALIYVSMDTREEEDIRAFLAARR
ncbi:hypothetical protein [Histidinibacterium lentulum]|uniref:hypothetical protein n=1 Tax=Histidinibacterium lentulum TaxID=2480588 RepID=UPI0016187566|nr:hypothetical protein [Histidinibacterium lentulum]